MRLMIFPITKESSAFARYDEMLVDYQSVALVTLEGFGADGSDFMTIDGGGTSGKQISTNFHNELDKSDAIYFTAGAARLPSAFLKKFIEEAAAKNKRIYIDAALTTMELPEVEVLCSDNFTCDDTFSDETPEFFLIPIPVIFVYGTGPYTNKFEVQLALRKNFIDLGYSVSQVGTRKESQFFGFSSLPDMFFNSQRTVKETVVALNRYFYSKYLSEKPEVMIVGIPGGITQVNPMRFEEMGDMAFLISQAITPDLSILCSYGHGFSEDHMNWLNNICKYRLNSPVSHFVLSNTDATLSFETHESEYMTVPMDFLRNSCTSDPKLAIDFFYALDKDSMKRLGSEVTKTLIYNL